MPPFLTPKASANKGKMVYPFNGKIVTHKKTYARNF